ncbi:MAG: hypothetical protein GY788_13900 [bacterium]|nr:hypothetical protein [bacterium]
MFRNLLQFWTGIRFRKYCRTSRASRLTCVSAGQVPPQNDAVEVEVGNGIDGSQRAVTAAGLHSRVDVQARLATAAPEAAVVIQQNGEAGIMEHLGVQIRDDRGSGVTPCAMTRTGACPALCGRCSWPRSVVSSDSIADPEQVGTHIAACSGEVEILVAVDESLDIACRGVQEPVSTKRIAFQSPSMFWKTFTRSDSGLSSPGVMRDPV